MFSRLSGRLSSLPSTRRKRKISDDGDEKGNNHHDDDDDDDDDGCGGRRWQQWGVIKNAQMSSGASRQTNIHTENFSSDSLFKTELKKTGPLSAHHVAVQYFEPHFNKMILTLYTSH